MRDLWARRSEAAHPLLAAQRRQRTKKKRTHAALKSLMILISVDWTAGSKVLLLLVMTVKC